MEFQKMDYLMKFMRESNYHKEPQRVQPDMIFLHQYILYLNQERQLRFRLVSDVRLNQDGFLVSYLVPAMDLSMECA